MPVFLTELPANKRYWIMRAGAAMQKFGDAWQVTALVEEIAPGCVRVCATSGKLYPGFRRDVFAKALEMGFTTIHWERRKKESIKEVCVEVSNGDY